MRFGFTNNPISDLLLRENISSNEDFQLVNLKQTEIEEKIRNGLLDGGLVDPITYSNLKKNVDVRIIPTTCLFLEDYSDTFGLKITNSHKELNKLSLNFESEYLYNISKILLNERYEIDIMNVPSNGGSEIVYDNSQATLDISEDWYESFKYALPMLFWVVKYEDGKVPVEDYINLFNAISISENEVKSTPDNTRMGRIIRNWETICENSLDETLELLYYNNLVNELQCSKIFINDDI
jgi:hypothetical protein